jgi:hypothetical protein
MSDQRTVRVATCHDPAEAMMIRSVLDAHGIDAMIPGEGAPSVATAAVGFRTHVFVDREDAETAAALIAELREGGAQIVHEEGEGDEGAGDDAEDGEDGDADRALATSDVAVAVDRRKRLGATVLLALVISFGTAHMSTGAWKRGFALAAVEIVGIRHLAVGHRWGIALVLGAVLVDLVGAIVRVRKRGAPSNLPTARLRR